MQHTLRGARILFWDQCNGDEANTASQMGDSGWYGVRPNALSVTRQPHRSNPFQDHGLACVETRAVARTQKIAGFFRHSNCKTRVSILLTRGLPQ